MPLKRFGLIHNEDQNVWQLKDSGGKTTKDFDTKAEATAGGVLESLIGSAGGSVRIHKLNGQFQEERTFPRREDPRSSKG